MKCAREGCDNEVSPERRRYCSATCADRAHAASNNRTRKQRYTYQKGRCVICGGKYFKRGPKRTCSPACSREHGLRRERVRGRARTPRKMKHCVVCNNQFLATPSRVTCGAIRCQDQYYDIVRKQWARDNPESRRQTVDRFIQKVGIEYMRIRTRNVYRKREAFKQAQQLNRLMENLNDRSSKPNEPTGK